MIDSRSDLRGGLDLHIDVKVDNRFMADDIDSKHHTSGVKQFLAEQDRGDALPLVPLLALFASVFITSLTETLPAGVLPAMSEGLDVSESAAGQTIMIYALGSCCRYRLGIARRIRQKSCPETSRGSRHRVRDGRNSARSRARRSVRDIFGQRYRVAGTVLSHVDTGCCASRCNRGVGSRSSGSAPRP